MKKIRIPELVIETTRKCNMACDHCLRGDAEALDQKKEYIDTLLDQVDDIDSVTFSGGEPSLNVPIIQYFLDACIKRVIDINTFYIATNGLTVKEDFIIICLRLYSYCQEKKLCQVEVSNDYYHAQNDSYDTTFLDGLSFFRRKYEKESDTMGNGQYVIPEGRGADFGTGRILDTEKITTQERIDEAGATLYLNCNGDIINGCDWSYDSQNDEELIFCSVGKLSETYYSLDAE